MKQLLVHNWSFMRIIRIAGGIYLLINGIIDQEHVFTGLGGLILVQGVLNWGCGGSCATNSYKTKTDDNDKVR